MGDLPRPSRTQAPLITLDTSAVVALLDRRDPDHARIRKAISAERSPYFVPAWALAEITYLAARRLGSKTIDAFLADLESGDLTLDCGDEDVARVRELVSRYADLPLSAADAAVVACAERNGGRVLTLDADFSVVAKEGQITVHPG